MTRVWGEHHDCAERANDLADRMLRAQIGLAEAMFKREWDENTAPMLSVLLPGTRAGGIPACRFDHPDQFSNGPRSSLRMRMSSLGISPEQNGPNAWMMETSWVSMTKAERLFLTTRNWHVEWKCPQWA